MSAQYTTAFVPCSSGMTAGSSGCLSPFIQAPGVAALSAKDDSWPADQRRPCAVNAPAQYKGRPKITYPSEARVIRRQHVEVSSYQQQDAHSCTAHGQQQGQFTGKVKCCNQVAGSNSSSNSTTDSLLSVSLAAMGCVPVPGYQPSSSAGSQRCHKRQVDTGGCMDRVHQCNGSSSKDIAAGTVHSSTRPLHNTSSSVSSSSRANSSGSCSSDEESTASSSDGRELVESLQLDCKRQAEQLRWKDQQLNEMMLRHQQLLRELLEVKAANETLRLEKQMQQSKEGEPDQACAGVAQWQQQLQDWQQLQSLPLQAQLVQPSILQQNLSTPFSTPTSAGVGQGAWRSVQLPLGGTYLPTPPSPGAPALMSPSPPCEAVQSRRPQLRRHRTWNSLQQLEQSTGSPITAAEPQRQRRTDTGVIGTSSRLSRHAGMQARSAGSPAAAGISCAADPSMAEFAAAVVTASAGVSVSLSQRRSRSQVCFEAAQGEPALLSSGSSSRTSEAAASPHVRFQLRGMEASPPAAQQQAAKFAPAPPREGPLTEGGRAARLRYIAKKDLPLQSSPIDAQVYRIAVDPTTTLCMWPASMVMNNAVLGRRGLSLDGSLASSGFHRGRTASESGGSGAAAFDAAVERYSSMLKP